MHMYASQFQAVIILTAFLSVNIVESHKARGWLSHGYCFCCSEMAVRDVTRTSVVQSTAEPRSLKTPDVLGAESDKMTPILSDPARNDICRAIIDSNDLDTFSTSSAGSHSSRTTQRSLASVTSVVHKHKSKTTSPRTEQTLESSHVNSVTELSQPVVASNQSSSK